MPSTFPAAIPSPLPGLLLCGSPVVILTEQFFWLGGYLSPRVAPAGAQGAVREVGQTVTCAVSSKAYGESLLELDASDVALDLLDPTGRIHFLWWAERATRDLPGFFTTPEEGRVIDLVRYGRDMSADDIALLHAMGMRIIDQGSPKKEPPFTLPGSIPELLQKGSLVVSSNGVRGAVLGIGDDNEVLVGWLDDWSMERGPPDKLDVHLDLREATSRVHAGWWADTAGWRIDGPTNTTGREGWLICAAWNGEDMTPDDIAALRALCLRLAEEAVVRKDSPTGGTP